MLKCEGYKMFQGIMTVVPKPQSGMPAFDVIGTWLYKPETDCWYCNGSSYVASICVLKDDFTKQYDVE